VARYIVEASAADGLTRERLSIEAATPAEAAKLLIALGHFPLSVRAERVGWAARLDQVVGSSSRMGLAELALFAEQLADLVRAGVVLEQALELLSLGGRGLRSGGRSAPPGDRRDRTISRLAQRLLLRVREGASLSAALQSEPGVPRAFAGVVQGAEGAGKLAAGLGSLAVSVQRQSETRERIRTALAYPATVLVVALAAVLFVLTAVIPEFSPLFVGEEQRLPRVTRAVLWLSDLLTGRLSWIGLLLLLATGVGWLVWRHSPGLRAQAWQHARRLPPVRHAMRLDLAQATRVMGALLESGMEASQAMQLAAQSASFAANQTGFADGARRLREGAALSRVYAALPYVPDVAASLLAVGERSGQAGAAATRAAQLIETDTNRRIASLLAALNPVAVISLGALVALFIAAIMLGILSINQLALR